MSVIIGIDPGSRLSGYGIITFENKSPRYVDSGCIRVKGESISEKMAEIFEGVDSLIQQYRPQLAAIEQVFVGKNSNSAIKLGQARGAAMAAVARHGIDIAEYAPRAIKQAVVGSGAAEKAQVSHMVCHLLKLQGVPQVDAGDALAVALCHAFRIF